MYKHVIFDFDMTLVDTSKGSAFCYEMAFKAAGGIFNKENLSLYMGEFLDATYNRIANPLITYEEFEKTFYYYSHRFMAEQSILFPEVKKVLNELGKYVVLSIVTNKDEKCVFEILKFHNIPIHMFECIICCDEVINKKPHPEALIKCMNRLNANKLESIYIGDNMKDVEFANNAGIDSIRVNREKHINLKENEIESLFGLIEGDLSVIKK